MSIMKWNRVKNFYSLWRWLLTAKTIHQIDSPAIYDFYKTVIDPGEPRATNRYEKKSDDHPGNDVPDQSNTSNGLNDPTGPEFSSRRDQLLSRVILYFQPKNILYIGSSSERFAFLQEVINGDIPIVWMNSGQTIYKNEDSTQRDISGTLQMQSRKIGKEDWDVSVTRGFDLIYIDRWSVANTLLSDDSPMTDEICKASVTILDNVQVSTMMDDVYQNLKDQNNHQLFLDLWYFVIISKDQRIHHPLHIRMSPFKTNWQPGLFRT